MVLAPPSAGRKVTDLLAHHPDRPDFAQDVYLVAGVRLCIGCFTTYPVFFLAIFLASHARQVAPSVLIVAGLLLASFQVVSSLGRARRRWQKAIVKSALGLGLGIFVAGVATSPWPPLVRVAALLGALALALASTIPRARRMRRAHCERAELL